MYPSLYQVFCLLLVHLLPRLSGQPAAISRPAAAARRRGRRVLHLESGLLHDPLEVGVADADGDAAVGINIAEKDTGKTQMKI